MKKCYKKIVRYCSLAIGVASLNSGCLIQAHAQLKDCSAFIQGSYVEVGVNYNGAYGAAAAAPSGYHPRNIGSSSLEGGPVCTLTSASDSILGFVVDIGKDGWGTGAPGMPNYFGDYFVPGVPQEGWSIMTETKQQINCWNGDATGGFASGLSGGHTRYSVSGSKIATEWQGIYDSLQIIQRTILDTANTYFVIRVKIKNLAHRKRTDIYYLRTVDPDNDIIVGGAFTTNNNIEYQNPNPSGLSVVSARGTAFASAYLALGTKDVRARCFIMGPGSGLKPQARLDTLHSGLDTINLYNAGDSLMSQDVGIGLVYKIDSLPANDSTILKMAYTFGGPGSAGGATDDEGLLPEEENPTQIQTTSLINPLIKIAPNPFNATLSIRGAGNADKILIYNLQGTLVSSCIVNNGTEMYVPDASALPSGMYLLTIQDKNGLLKHREIIQRR